MIRLKKLGHIQLQVADLERSKAFYRDVLGFPASPSRMPSTATCS